jgi:hypothetical protein
MSYHFTDDPPTGADPVLLAGGRHHPVRVYLVGAPGQPVFELRSPHHCSPFREAAVAGNLLAVGWEQDFCLYDLAAGRRLLEECLNGYFGHLYVEGGLFYVASAEEITCVAPSGEILWRSPDVGVDGVEIERFLPNQIIGRGDMDPPGGWVPFVLDRASGRAI